MLTPSFYEEYNPIPRAPVWTALASGMRAWMRATGFHVDVEHLERLPAQPALLCTNSTQRHDFFALMRGLDQHGGKRVVTVTKAKNFHSALMSFVMKRSGVVPLASRGYVIAVDFRDVFVRKPTNDEYRQIRNHLDHDAPLPDALRALLTAKRAILGVPFDPDVTSYREHVQHVYRVSLGHTVRLARIAVEAGYHVQIYPEGTVSRQLGTGRIGAVQLARALGLTMVPIGMSGCPEAFFGESPVPAGGVVRVRIGEPIDLASTLPSDHKPFDPQHEATNRAALLRATGTLMDRIEALVEDPYKRPLGASLPTKGVRAFL